MLRHNNRRLHFTKIMISENRNKIVAAVLMTAMIERCSINLLIVFENGRPPLEYVFLFDLKHIVFGLV